MPDQGYQRQLTKSQLIFIGFCLTAILACGITRDSESIETIVAAGIEATRQAENNIQATINAAVAATQQANQIDSQPSPTFTPIFSSQLSDVEQVRSVVLNEVKGAVSRDLALLQSLYAPGAVVIDHRGTPDDLSDDTQWQGWANIKRRYLESFPTGFTTADLVNLTIQVDGNQARGTHEGVIFDGTLYEDQALYALEKINGQWLIIRLEYGHKKVGGLNGTVSAPSLPIAEGLYILK